MQSMRGHLPKQGGSPMTGRGACGGFGVGRSPSGKAPDFGSGIEGSNPSRPANTLSPGNSLSPWAMGKLARI